jgi:hypothetical protein
VVLAQPGKGHADSYCDNGDLQDTSSFMTQNDRSILTAATVIPHRDISLRHRPSDDASHSQSRRSIADRNSQASSGEAASHSRIRNIRTDGNSPGATNIGPADLIDTGRQWQGRANRHDIGTSWRFMDMVDKI